MLEDNFGTNNFVRYQAIFAMIVACFFILLPEFAALSVQPEPDVVAIVNGEPVSRAEFKRMVENPLTRRQAQDELKIEDPPSGELKKLALRKVIHHRLLLQEGRKRNITVTQDELDSAVAALRKQFGELKHFGLWMKEQGLNDQLLFETVKADIITDRVRSLIAQYVVVPEEKIKAYFELHKNELVLGEQLRLRIIAVREKTGANEIVAELKNGAAFNKLARERSYGLLASKGGDTGWIDSTQLPEPLSKVVPFMKSGDVAGPLEKESGEFLIVALEDRRPLLAKSLEDARLEIERKLTRVAQFQTVQTWLTEQEKKSRIQIFMNWDQSAVGQ